MRHRVVIVGGGFGGLETALTLREILKSAVEITLIDRVDHHAFIPSIHEIVSGRTTAADIRTPLAVVLGPAGVGFLRAEVRSIDPEARRVFTDAEEVPYDYLVIATGAENSFAGVEGADRFAHRFRSPLDAEEIRTRFQETAQGPKGGRIILAGGGTEGVELAGELADALARERALGRAGSVELEIVAGRPRLLPEFPSAASDYAEERLRDHGVRLTLENRIVSVEEGSVTLASGGRRTMSMLVWTGGIRPSSLIESLTFSKDDHGWLKVAETLRSPDDGRVYGIGDAVSIFRGDEAVPLGRLAYHALDQAVVAALNIHHHIRKETPAVYAPKDRPQLVSIGREGILVQGNRTKTGAWVIGLKKVIERRHLMTVLSRSLLAPVTGRLPGAGYVHALRLYSPL